MYYELSHELMEEFLTICNNVQFQDANQEYINNQLMIEPCKRADKINGTNFYRDLRDIFGKRYNASF